MREKVIVTIKGAHETEQGDDILESTAVGEYGFEGGTHVIAYDEVGDVENPCGQTVRCTLRISDSYVMLHKEGAIETNMEFFLGKRAEATYSTPMGDFIMGFDTVALEIEESEDLVTVKLAYNLFMNDEFVSKCALEIEVKSA